MKDQLLQQAIDYLKTEWEHLSRAARDGRDGATDEENRSESKYDTRGLEAGYLAQGQAEQAQLIEEQINYLSGLQLEEEPSSSQVGRGSIVVLSNLEGEEENFFLLPHAGGAELDWQGQPCTVLSPEAPLTQQLVGRSTGDFLADGRYISELY